MPPLVQHGIGEDYFILSPSSLVSFSCYLFCHINKPGSPLLRFINGLIAEAVAAEEERERLMHNAPAIVSQVAPETPC
jgi:hypothetical protein